MVQAAKKVWHLHTHIQRFGLQMFKIAIGHYSSPAFGVLIFQLNQYYRATFIDLPLKTIGKR
jgi:hypothetical protein